MEKLKRAKMLRSFSGAGNNPYLLRGPFPFPVTIGGSKNKVKWEQAAHVYLGWGSGKQGVQRETGEET